MTNFKQAIKWLKEEKKVKRPSWEEDSYWIIGSEGVISWKDGTTAHVHLNQIEADDWEVFEDKEESLSDKTFYAVAPSNEPAFGRDCVNVKDVRWFIRKNLNLTRKFMLGDITWTELREKQDKLAGDKFK